jgi:hypothetical protein
VDDVLTLSRPEMREGRAPVIPAVMVGVFLVVALVLASFAMRTPDMVSLRVDNPLQWRTEVSVRSADSTSWTGVGAVARDGELEFLQLPDQGSEWVVRFSYAGASEEVTVTRDELEAQDWTIQAPESLGAQLDDAGIAPTTGSSAG